MDQPIRPEEQLVDALRSLTLAFDKIADLLEILTCELIVTGAWVGAHPEDEGPITP
jgi:hypothetical protein